MKNKEHYYNSPSSDSSLFYFLQLILFPSFSLPFLSAITTVFCFFSLLSIFSFSFHFASCLCWLVINRDSWFLHPFNQVLLKLTVQSPPNLSIEYCWLSFPNQLCVFVTSEPYLSASQLYAPGWKKIRDDFSVFSWGLWRPADCCWSYRNRTTSASHAGQYLRRL